MCDTIDRPHRCGDINAHITKEKYDANKNSNFNLTATDNKGYIVDYVLPGPNMEGDKRARGTITEIMHNEFKDVVK